MVLMIIFKAMISVEDPPNKLDPNLSEVASVISVHLNNDLQKFYQFGESLLVISEEDTGDKIRKRRAVKEIEQNGKKFKDKCLDLLCLYIDHIYEAKWEQVIEVSKKTNLSGLTKELEGIFNKAKQTQIEITAPERGKISYSYITSTNRISLLLHETNPRLSVNNNGTYLMSTCDITGLCPCTAFDHKQIRRDFCLSYCISSQLIV